MLWRAGMFSDEIAVDQQPTTFPSTDDSWRDTATIGLLLQARI